MFSIKESGKKYFALPEKKKDFVVEGERTKPFLRYNTFGP